MHCAKSTGSTPVRQRSSPPPVVPTGTSPAQSCSTPESPPSGSTSGPMTSRTSAASATRNYAPPISAGPSSPAFASCSSGSPDGDGVILALRHRQLRAGREAEAGARRHRAILPQRSGSVRIGQRGSRRTAGDRSPARQRARPSLPARGDDRDRRHPARHRVRQSRRRQVRGGSDRVLRSRGARAGRLGRRWRAGVDRAARALALRLTAKAVVRCRRRGERAPDDHLSIVRAPVREVGSLLFQMRVSDA